MATPVRIKSTNPEGKVVITDYSEPGKPADKYTRDEILRRLQDAAKKELEESSVKPEGGQKIG